MVVVLDFESLGIEPRPAYPPTPVGIAVYEVDNQVPPYYMAFMHPTNNNYTRDEARNKTKDLLAHCDKLIFHNAPFDCAILEEKWDLEVPWDRVEDTMVMAFLDDPHGELALKPLAEKHLDVPPTERDAVHDWLYQHGIIRANMKNWGKYIAYAPGDLVGEYAIGDVVRTYQLWEYYNAKRSAA